MRVLFSVVAVVVLGVGLSAQTDQFFDKAGLSVQINGKTEMVDTFLRFDGDSFDVVAKKSKQTIKSYAYPDIKSIEYSYAKSPRWKTALFVSPFFLFTSGKKHWLLTQGPDDFAMLRLDKNNYKMILATLESKTGKQVETVGDEK
jgi:hypothetical protein